MHHSWCFFLFLYFFFYSSSLFFPSALHLFLAIIVLFSTFTSCFLSFRIFLFTSILVYNFIPIKSLTISIFFLPTISVFSFYSSHSFPSLLTYTFPSLPVMTFLSFSSRITFTNCSNHILILLSNSFLFYILVLQSPFYNNLLLYVLHTTTFFLSCLCCSNVFPGVRDNFVAFLPA